MDEKMKKRSILLDMQLIFSRGGRKNIFKSERKVKYHFFYTSLIMHLIFRFNRLQHFLQLLSREKKILEQIGH